MKKWLNPKLSENLNKNFAFAKNTRNKVITDIKKFRKKSFYKICNI